MENKQGIIATYGSIFLNVLFRITSYNVCYTKLLRFENLYGTTTRDPGWRLAYHAPSNYAHEDKEMWPLDRNQMHRPACIGAP